MALAFAASLHIATGMRTLCKINSISSGLNATRNSNVQKKLSCSAVVTIDRTQASDFELENKKHYLLNTIQGTQRGFVTTADQRSIIEEALVDLEGYKVIEPIDLVKLDGTWRLQYTSAPDVLVLFEAAARLPFFEITVQNINIGEELQAVIAPAILPRSFLSLQILQFIRAFKAQIPVTNPNPGRRSVGGLYYLSYLDNNMLLGRAVGGGGVFVFTKAQPLGL